MFTDSQTKFIDAIVYDTHESPQYYAKLSQAEKYRMTHRPNTRCDMINIQVLGIKNTKQNNRRFCRVAGKTSLPSNQNRQKTFTRAVIPARIKSNKSLKRISLKPEVPENRIPEFCESTERIFIQDGCFTTNCQKHINSQTYNKYSPNTFLKMDESLNETSRVDSVKPFDADTAIPKGFPYNFNCNETECQMRSSGMENSSKMPKNEEHKAENRGSSIRHLATVVDKKCCNERVHAFQRFNKPHCASKDWPSFYLPECLSFSERPLEKISECQSKQNSSQADEFNQNNATHKITKIKHDSLHNNSSTLNNILPSVNDYINAYTVMSPRMNEKSTNTKENFHSLVKERFALPNKMYESSSSPAFYEDLNKSRQKWLLEDIILEETPLKSTAEKDVFNQKCSDNLPPEHQTLKISVSQPPDERHSKHTQLTKKERKWKIFFRKLNCRKKNT